MLNKLGRKGTHPQLHHTVAQGRPFPKKFWLTTRSPQTMPLLQHSSTLPHHNHTTYFLCRWSNTTSTQSTTFLHSDSRQNVHAISSGSSSSLTNWTSLGGSDGGGVSKAKSGIPPPLMWHQQGQQVACITWGIKAAWATKHAHGAFFKSH